jgi:hypothetical protein
MWYTKIFHPNALKYACIKIGVLGMQINHLATLF